MFQNQVDLILTKPGFFKSALKSQLLGLNLLLRKMYFIKETEKCILQVYLTTIMSNKSSSVCAALQMCHIPNKGAHHLRGLFIQVRQVQVHALDETAISLLHTQERAVPLLLCKLSPFSCCAA